MRTLFYKSTAIFLALLLSLPPSGFSQSLTPGSHPVLTLPQGDFAPVVLRGIKVDPKNPFKFKFIIDPNDAAGVSKKDVSNLMEYFLTALTINEKDIWVNLSPYEKERVIPQALGRTITGQELLSQDHLLKQLAASLTYPENTAGKKYWSDAASAGALSKVWIVPGRAQVYEGSNSVVIVDARLRVMTQDDYFALRKEGLARQNGNNTNGAATEAFKSHILPLIEKDVNAGKNFARLRQMYNAFILAVWFKHKLKDSIYRFYIDQGKTSGIKNGYKGFREDIYSRYVDSFKRGVYDYVQTSRDVTGHKLIKRKYFAGGVSVVGLSDMLEPVASLPSSIERSLSSKAMVAQVELDPEQARVNEADILAQANETLDRVLALCDEDGKFDEQFALTKQLHAMGPVIVPLLIDRLKVIDDNDQQIEIIDILRKFADTRAIDILVETIAAHLDDYLAGCHAAWALGDLGAKAVPYLEKLLREHGPVSNILRAIAQSRQASFIPVLKNISIDSTEAKEDIARALLELGDKDGLVSLIDIVADEVKKYEDNKNEHALSSLGMIGAILYSIDSYDRRETAKKILRLDSVLSDRIVDIFSPVLGDITDGQMLRKVVDILGYCATDKAAKVLWTVYKTRGNSPAEKRNTLLAMANIGEAAIPYLTNGEVENSAVYDILGKIGSVKGLPFLLKAYRDAGSGLHFKEEQAVKKAIREAIKEIGDPAVDSLVGALSGEDYKDAYNILLHIKPPRAISGMLDLLSQDIPAANKRAIVMVLGEMGRGGGPLVDFMRKNPLKKKTLFDAASGIIAVEDDNLAILDVGIALRESFVADGVERLLKLYRASKTDARREIMHALSTIDDERVWVFFLEEFVSGEISAKDIAGALAGEKKFERLKKHFVRYPELGYRVVERLSHDSDSISKGAAILAAAATPSSLSALVMLLSKKIKGKEEIDELVGALIKTGQAGRTAIMQGHQQLVKDVEEYCLRELPNIDLKSSKEFGFILALEKWLYFTSETRGNMPITRSRVQEEYYSRREKVADLMVRVKAYLKQHPDSTYKDIIAYIGADMDNLSPRARVRFKLGAIKYVKDHQRVKALEAIMDKAGVARNTLIDLAKLEFDPKNEQVQFFQKVLGFLPTQAAVFVAGDAVHIVLDRSAYGHMRYRSIKNISRGEKDNYDDLSLLEQARFQDSGGVYSPGGSISIDEISFHGIFTFEDLGYKRLEERDGHTQDHEVQHKFYHAYASDETVDLLVYDAGNIVETTHQINTVSGSEQERLAALVVKRLASNILLRFQDEMIAKIVDAQWAGQDNDDYEEWFDFYRNWYGETVDDYLRNIDDASLRQRMTKGVFERARVVIDRARPFVKRLLDVKTQLFETQEKIAHDEAVVKANNWVAAFLQTMPITRMDRLGPFVDSLEAQLVRQVESQAVKDTKNLGGIDLNSRYLKLKSNNAIKFSFTSKDLLRLRNCRGLGYQVMTLSRGDLREFLR